MFRQGKVKLFREPTRLGRKSGGDSSLDRRIMELRHQGFSIYGISGTLAAEGIPVSRNKVRNVIEEKSEGKRLPKKTVSERWDTATPNLPLPIADISELDLAAGRVMQCRAQLLFETTERWKGVKIPRSFRTGQSGFRWPEKRLECHITLGRENPR